MMKKFIFALTFVSMIAVVNQSFAGKTGSKMRQSTSQSTSTTKKSVAPNSSTIDLGCIGTVVFYATTLALKVSYILSCLFFCCCSPF
jgi:hypothetical protein